MGQYLSLNSGGHDLSRYGGGLELYKQSVMGAFKERPDETVWRWMEQVCLVRGEYEGLWNSELTPFAREPLECFRNKAIEDLTICSAAQVMKTTVVMGGVAWRIVHDPSDSLWVMPDKDFGGSFSRQRWQPFVEDCGPLSALRPTGSDRRTFFTNFEQRFGRMALFFVGSNSATQVAGRSCGTVIMDETDKFGLRTDKEAGALQNAEERTKTFNYPLIVKTSTPTVYHGEIWQNFLLGDQRYFWVPCPRCGQGIRLLWSQVKWWTDSEDEAKTNGEWDFEKVRKNTFYQCQLCGDPIRDAEKRVMCLEGEWRSSVETAAKERRSYHINSLYAPWKKTQWPELAVLFLKSRGSISARQRFINSTLAEPFDMEQAYDVDPIQTEPAYLVAAFERERRNLMSLDVQAGATYLWGVIRAWMANGESWLLWQGRIDSIEEAELLQAEYAVQPEDVIVDLRHMPNVVSRWIVDHGWRGAMGADKRGGFPWKLPNGNTVYRAVSQPKARDPHLGTVHQSPNNKPAMYVEWSNELILDLLATMRFADNTKWHVRSDIVTPDYVRQINSWQKQYRKNPRTGKPSVAWRQISKHDHLLDCECQQLVHAIMHEIIVEDSERYASAQQALKIVEIEKGH